MHAATKSAYLPRLKKQVAIAAVLGSTTIGVGTVACSSGLASTSNCAELQASKYLALSSHGQ